MKNRTKTISLLVAVCMMLTLLPAVAFAAGGLTITEGVEGTDYTYTGKGDSDGGVLTIKQPGEYTVSGTTNDRIVVEASDVTLILNNVNITNYNNTPLIINKSATLILPEDTNSSVIGNYRITGISIAVGETACIEGDGALKVSGGYQSHAINGNISVSSGTLTVNGGTYADCIKGDVTVTGGSLTVKCGTNGDGIKGEVNVSNGTLYIKGGSSTDCIEGPVDVDGGSLTVECGTDGDGIKGEVTVSKGTLYIEGGSSTDCIEGPVDVYGGSLTINSGSHGDGIKGGVRVFNGTLTINGGTSGYAINGDVEVTGGTINAEGSEYSDGINGDVTISVGTLAAIGGSEGNGINGKIDYTSGLITAIGAYGCKGITEGLTSPVDKNIVLVGESGSEDNASGWDGTTALNKYRYLKIGEAVSAPTPPDGTATISGTITSPITSPYDKITVKLVSLDGTEYAGTTGAVTQKNEEYSCTYTAKAPKGYNYNVVVTAEYSNNNNSVTVTQLVLLDGDKPLDIELPTGEKNSIVEDVSDDFNAIVDGVDDIAEDQNESDVTITFKVGDVADGDTGAAAIKAETGDKAVDFVDLSLYKQVGSNGPVDIGDENNKLLTILLKYDTSRSGIQVFRYHDNGPNSKVYPLTEINEGEVESKISGYNTSPPLEGVGYFWVGNGYIGILADKFSTYAVAYTPATNPPPSDAPGTVDPGTSSGGYSGPSIWYIGGNTFGTSTSQVPTSVEIDGVPVPFTMNGSNIVVGCVAPDADRIRVIWGNVSNSIGFTPDAAASCAQVFVPKTGDVSVMAFALMAVIAAAGAMGKK